MQRTPAKKKDRISTSIVNDVQDISELDTLVSVKRQPAKYSVRDTFGLDLGPVLDDNGNPVMSGGKEVPRDRQIAGYVEPSPHTPELIDGYVFPKDDTLALLMGMDGKDPMLLVGHTGTGKCVSGDTLIVDPDTGRLIPIRECGFLSSVLALNPNSFRSEKQVVAAWVPSGYKPTIEVVFRSGRSIVTTLSHKYFTPFGWTQVNDISVGDRVATPREYKNLGCRKVSPSKLTLLGMLIADGGLTGGTPAWTKHNKEMVQIFRGILDASFPGMGQLMHPREPSSPHDYSLTDSGHREKPNRLTVWLRSLEVFGKLSKDKVTPDLVFEAINSQDYLQGLLSSDLSVDEDRMVIEYYSASQQLCKDVQHLLLRHGVLSSTKYKKATCEGKDFDSWRVTISGKENLINFVERIKIFGPKSVQVQQLILNLKKIKPNTNTDTIPHEFWGLVKQEMERRNKTWKDVVVGCGWRDEDNYKSYGCFSAHSKRGISRNRLLRLADFLCSDQLEDLATSNIFWDEVVEINDAGVRDVYDLCQPFTENFVAADIFCHNTSLVEQIAARLNYGVIKISFDGAVSRHDLIGEWVIKGKEMQFQYGVIPLGFRMPGTIILLDEWDAQNEETAFVLQRPLQKEDRKIFVVETNKLIPMHPENIIIATANTNGQGDDTGLYSQGTRVQSYAQLNRFQVTVRLDYLEAKHEKEMLGARYPTLDNEEIDSLVTAVNKVRDGFSNGMVSVPLSTRDLINWSDKYLKFGDAMKAARYCFLNRMSLEDSKVVEGIIQRSFEDA